MINNITDKDVLDAFASFIELDFNRREHNGLGNLIFKNLVNVLEEKDIAIKELRKNIFELNKKHDENCRLIEENTRKDAWTEFAERAKNYANKEKNKKIEIKTIDKIREEMFKCEGWE